MCDDLIAFDQLEKESMRIADVLKDTHSEIYGRISRENLHAI